MLTAVPLQETSTTALSWRTSSWRTKTSKRTRGAQQWTAATCRRTAKTWSRGRTSSMVRNHKDRNHGGQGLWGQEPLGFWLLFVAASCCCGEQHQGLVAGVRWISGRSGEKRFHPWLVALLSTHTHVTAGVTPCSIQNRLVRVGFQLKVTHCFDPFTS